MNAKVPQVSGKLREETLALAADPQDIIDRCYMAMAQGEGDYTHMSSSTGSDVIDSIRQSAALWFDAILTGTAPSPAVVEQFSLFGRKRVHQGISLTAVLGAFRIGSRELWNSYLAAAEKNDEIRDELLFSVTPYLLDHFGKMVQSIAEAYLDEQYQQSRRRDVLRYELCNIVFSDPGNVAEFNRVAEAIAIDPTVPRVAMAFETNLSMSMFSRVEADLDNVLVRIARVAKVDMNDLVRVIHRERLVVWIPCIRGDSILASDRRMEELATRLIASVSDLKLAGVGMMGQGPAGWASSVDEALKALEFGVRTDVDDNVFRYSDIALREGARRADNVLRYLESLIERLSHEPELLKTLECYLDQFQRRKQTAAILGIHPNTLNYRLDRIQEMTGSNLEDPGWLAKLHVAVKLRRGSLGE
jgi:sugar diacid utilization regulator